METNILNDYIGSKGLSYVDVAQRTGLHPSTVRRHALGEIKPRLDALNVYARVLRIPIGKLLKWHTAAQTD